MDLITSSSISDLLNQTSRLNIDETLRFLAEKFPGQVVFSSSFSVEDQAISHMILSQKLPITIFTLDTGRMFPETYSVWRSTNERYETTIKSYNPDSSMLEIYLDEKGPNAFYESVENRKECCFIRKVAPLKRALAGKAIWITGLRAEHSTDREQLDQFERDESNHLIKYHPILHWSTEQVKDYIKEHHIPYNPLHDKGFVSIGCLPCTRAIQPGEDFRAGRWWWENSEGKECGLHVHN